MTTAFTLFSCPKPLDGGHIESIQRNAVESWTLMPGCPEVILFGDASIERLAAELGVRYANGVAHTETGAPLVDELFAAAEKHATTELLTYVNADIILLSEFESAVGRVAATRRRFLLVGQRTDLDLHGRIDFSNGWETELRERVAREGRLHGQTGIDYFAFPRGFWGDIPPFALGRLVWDNWLIDRARSSKSAVVDATLVVTAVHQNHDYGHIDGRLDGRFREGEAARNFELAGGWNHMRFIHDATHVLTPTRVVRALGRPYLVRRWQRFTTVTIVGRVGARLAGGVAWRFRRLRRWLR